MGAKLARPALRRSVTNYMDHLGDAPWIESLLARHGVPAVLQECGDALAEQKPGEVEEVTTFLQDIARRGFVNDELVTSVRAGMPTSVLPGLHQLLRAPVLAHRMAAIYTIGKLGFPSEIQALRAVFPAYLDGDPLCLARLLSELRCLGDRRGAQARVKRLVAHECHLVRWSALGHLDHWGSWASAYRPRAQWLRVLAADPVPLVSQEARYQLAALERDEPSAKATRGPGQRDRGAPAPTAPAITFSGLEIQFLQEMHRTGRVDYSLEDLARFSLEKYPWAG